MKTESTTEFREMEIVGDIDKNSLNSWSGARLMEEIRERIGGKEK